mgnify:CR=1 FL=1
MFDQSIQCGDDSALLRLNGDYLNTYVEKLHEAHKLLDEANKANGEKRFEKLVRPVRAFAEIGQQRKGSRILRTDSGSGFPIRPTGGFPRRSLFCSRSDLSVGRHEGVALRERSFTEIEGLVGSTRRLR